MHRVLVSNQAESDLLEIWLWSFDKFGESQADRYLDELAEGLQACGNAPTRGKQRESLRSGYWSCLIRRHVAFYTISDQVVTVHRVLHGSMDPDLHL